MTPFLDDVMLCQIIMAVVFGGLITIGLCHVYDQINKDWDDHDDGSFKW